MIEAADIALTWVATSRYSCMHLPMWYQYRMGWATLVWVPRA